MTLNSSGPISIGGATTGQSINLELGRSATATSSLNETSLRTLAGVSSGAISLSNFYGKSNAPTFSPDGGASAGAPVALYDFGVGNDVVTITIECDGPAVWNYTRSGSFGTPTTGSTTATQVNFILTNGTASIRSTTWTVNATAGGVTKYWTVQIDHEGFV